eukprot:CAMPEP_0198251750 /NCGR_PEP_ID=MMETSP1447-20131203/2483_1 /TAXON_ID=420782 /ORGANISM="Chaetoceros dichaeta, Strain CCMP1751" /LENGTH=470 /DNA_ID=CAMNT_0043936843 /DNA_START=119 /DNA_END=1531 /DNA_ORIENTATION=+
MPPQHYYDSKKILRDLESNNEFFDDLVDMIPAKLYVAGNTGDEMYNPKYRKGQHKESKEFRRARAKASFIKKFDPNLAETTRDTQRRLKEEEDNDLDDDDSDDDDDAAAINDIDDDTNDTDGHAIPPDTEMTDTNEPTNEEDEPTPSSKTPPYQSRIELLRAKLRAKLDAKRGNNKSSSTTTTDGTIDNSALISKRAARRAAKQKRIDIAKRRNTGGSTQTGGNSKRPNGRNGGDGGGLTEEELGGSKILSLSSTPSGDDLLAGIDYGGIAGLKDDVGANYTKSNKSLQNMGKKKSLEHLLAVAAANREKLDKLKASADFEDKAKVKKVEWGKALKAASGTRTNKNDTTLLKKAIKRKAKKKAKSQQGWKTRMDQVKGKMDERQKIREHNIGQRKLGGAAGANLSRKRIDTEDNATGDGGGGGEKGGGGSKRPRLGPHSGNAPRAGFEGKKQDFINKGGKSSAGGGKKAQ